ncbi:MAG: molybdopterin-dependent oxidoreductase [Deltaproteobacteria bacterium]|nr:molybdopterin-dependent oxidoreductase [Deltaproteobacteria bacterium]
MPPERHVGKPGRKVDATDKVLGRTRYTADLSLPRMLACKLLRSPEPHAVLEGVDASAALAMPGVVAVLTGQDLPIPFGLFPISMDEHALCTDRVRFVGDPIAAVLAEDEELAEAGARALRPTLRPLPPVRSIEEAVAPTEHKIHDYVPVANIHRLAAMEFGDIEQALAGSSHVREDLFFYGGNTHLALEEHAALAEWSPDGRLTVWASTQTPHYLHRALVRVLELPFARIRVIAPPTGGGFGGKTEPFGHELVVAKAAMLTGRPVKIVLTREEVFACHRGRHPTLLSMRTGVDAEGRIQGIHVRTILDGGAYGSYGVASTYYTGALQTVTYQVPRYRFDGARVFTNKAPCGPKRGHGTPQGRFALEVQLDKLAEELSLCPAELRRRQLAPAGSTTANFLQIGSMGLGPCLEAVYAASGFRDKHGQLPFGRGVGIACSSYLSGAGRAIYRNDLPHSGASLKLDRGGGVTVYCGTTEVGQGSETVLATIAAEVLGVSPFDVRTVTGDTDLTPVDLGSYSSRVTVMAGRAVLQAAERAQELLRHAVAEKVQVAPEALVFADGRVFDAESPERGVTFSEAVHLAEKTHGTLVTAGSYAPPETPGTYRGAGVGPSPAYSYSAAVVEVTVDAETGIVRPVQVWVAHDVGRCINRQSVLGQVEGSVYMGLGEALMEEMAYLPKRGMLHRRPSLLQYKSPTSVDMCPIETFLIEEPDPEGPYGAKEVGQGPLLPIPPAVACAVYDAVGVRIDEVPITAEKVLKALTAKRAGKEPRVGPKAMPAVPWPTPEKVPPPWEGGDGSALPRPPKEKR